VIVHHVHHNERLSGTIPLEFENQAELVVQSYRRLVRSLSLQLLKAISSDQPDITLVTTLAEKDERLPLRPYDLRHKTVGIADVGRQAF